MAQESTCSICGYIAAYSKGGGRGHFSEYPGDHTCSFIEPQFTAPRFRSELKMAACYTKELALFTVCLLYEPTVELGTEKMRDAQNAPSGLHLDLMQLWSIPIVWFSSLCRQHSPHTLLVCLHTILVSITINFYRGKLTNISLSLDFRVRRVTSKLPGRDSWKVSPPELVFSHFVERKGTSVTNIIKKTCKSTHVQSATRFLGHFFAITTRWRTWTFDFFLLCKLGYGP